MAEGGLERVVRVRAFAFGLENGTRIQMQRAVGAKERTVVGKHDIRLGSAVKMLSDDILHTRSHANRECFANLNLFARNPNPHGLHLYWPERALQHLSSAVFTRPVRRARVFRPATPECQRLHSAKGGV